MSELFTGESIVDREVSSAGRLLLATHSVAPGEEAHVRQAL